jgi:hypothetical protein
METAVTKVRAPHRKQEHWLKHMQTMGITKVLLAFYTATLATLSRGMHACVHCVGQCDKREGPSRVSWTRQLVATASVH